MDALRSSANRTRLSLSVRRGGVGAGVGGRMTESRDVRISAAASDSSPQRLVEQAAVVWLVPSVIASELFVFLYSRFLMNNFAKSGPTLV